MIRIHVKKWKIHCEMLKKQLYNNKAYIKTEFHNVLFHISNNLTEI